MIEIHIRQAPIIHQAREVQGWRANALGALVWKAGTTYNETLGKVLVSLIASGAVNITIVNESPPDDRY